MIHRTEIIISDSFEAFHNWPDAPEEVLFLRSLHRHIFTVRVGIPVSHHHRQREFFIEKRKLAEVLLPFVGSESQTSCEMFAESIMGSIDGARWVEVFEDGENGARVEETEEDA